MLGVRQMMANQPMLRGPLLGEQLKSFFQRLAARPLPLDVLDMIDQLEAGNDPPKARVLADVRG